jgi:crossover junction endodeoxyribonuclease RuvC
VIVGIDPGIKGAAAAISVRGNVVDVIDLPTRAAGKRREVDPPALLRWMRYVKPHRIIIENVHSMPKEGVVSAFRFGVAVGMIRAISYSIITDVELVDPAVWKAYFDLLGLDKEASRQLALSIFPDWASLLTRKMDHQRAESLLIAKWGIRPIIGRNW